MPGCSRRELGGLKLCIQSFTLRDVAIHDHGPCEERIRRAIASAKAD